MNAKRLAARYVRNVEENGETALDVLFGKVGPRFTNSNGGYVRTLKLGNRRGDNAPIVVVAWVD